MATEIKNFLAKLKGISKDQRRRVGRRMVQFAEHVVGDAQQLTPVDTGALQSSGTVGELQDDGRRMSVEIGFNAEYAAAVHERLDVHHDNGQAKFLEDAMTANAPKMARFLEGEG